MSTVPQHNIRILVTRPDHIGDVLLTLPMLAHIKHALPQAQLSVLVPPPPAEVPRHCPYVDETLCATFPPLDKALDQAAWEEEAERQAASLRGRFDVALLPRPDDPWSGPLVRGAGIPVRLGYAAPRTKPYLTHTLPEPGKRHAADLGIRLADAALRLLGAQLRVPVEDTLHLFVSTREEEAEEECALAEVAALAGRGPLVLHPGAGWAIKRWPPGNWGRLARLLAEGFGVLPLVVTGPGEDDLRSEIIMESDGHAIGLAAPLSLGALAALHRRVRLVVGIDSGPLHLAAFMGCPVVGLFGPADPAQFRPLCPPGQLRMVAVKLPCSPCGTLLGPPCGARTHPACMAGIAPEQVLREVLDLLGLRERIAPPGALSVVESISPKVGGTPDVAS